MSESDITVRHNPGSRRFEAIVDGMLCRADYRLQGDTMLMVHTEVPAQLEGRGIASALVRAAFRHAAEQNLKVQPMCSYVRAWVKRHPDVGPLLAGDL
ncbi:MAG TPA: GNAT family N-acetyltransferase [Burkholderiaceae bacterium]|jgi:predicted GNAT family acetyltransferase|nr:GNAT family N-acetyltransferase [Burkholderiaceae bacterium]HQR69374.1 GNAT family N-acetyltransferase [Burkholderiaceae bacterium]